MRFAARAGELRGVADLYSLRLFGGLQLQGPDGSAVRLASRRRPVALLAVLAARGEQGASRDSVAALLWGDTDDRHALRSLSDALYTIRAELGPEAVLSSGNELRLNSAVVESDVGTFTAALRRGDRAAAVALWTGPVLEGFHLPGVQTFEEWLDAERRRIGAEYADALERLAVEEREAGDPIAAVTCWRRLAELDPYNSRVAVELARTLAQAKDPGNGLQVLQRHVEVLRKDLGGGPDAAVLKAIAELRAGSGGKPEESAVPAMAAAPPTRTGEAGVTTSRAWGLARLASLPRARPALATLALVVLVATGWGAMHLARAWFGPSLHSIAVLPLRNLTGDSTVGPFVDGVTEELTARLGSVGELHVTSRTSTDRYRDSRLGATEIAAALGVEGLLEGAVVRWGGSVRVTVQVIDARSDRHLGAETLERSWDSLYTLPSQLAEVVLRRLRIRPAPGERPLVARRSSRDPRVAALLAQGRAQEALVLDSTSARAWAARSLSLADSTWWWPQPVTWRPAPYVRAARDAADRAMRLDSTESDAHVALGAALQLTYHWAEAERELRRAIALQPSNALAHLNLACVLANVGRFAEAIAEGRIAKQLDPLSKAVFRELLWDLVLAKRWDEYDVEAAEWRRLWPDTVGLLDLQGNSLLFASICRGRPEQVVRLVESTLVLAGDSGAWRYDLARAIALSRMGRRDEAVATVRRAERRTDVYMRRFWMAWAYAAVGDLDRAANAFRDAASMGESGLIATLRTCVADPLRADPRWPELLRLVNLPR